MSFTRETLGVVLLFAVAFQFHLPDSPHALLDYDEGLNLGKAFMLAKGYVLYSQIWSDQPPFYTYLLQFWTDCFGYSLQAARRLTAVFSGVLLGSLSREKERVETSGSRGLRAAGGQLLFPESLGSGDDRTACACPVLLELAAPYRRHTVAGRDLCLGRGFRLCPFDETVCASLSTGASRTALLQRGRKSFQNHDLEFQSGGHGLSDYSSSGSLILGARPTATLGAA